MTINVFFSRTSRGKLALIANGNRYTILSETDEKILWRCAAQASCTKKKCPARITQYHKKSSEPIFVLGKEEHVHAVLKRGPYNRNKHDPNPLTVYKDETFKQKNPNKMKIL